MAYDEKECCYENMSDDIGGQSEPQECWDEPYRNGYENSRKGYNDNGLDQSGMKGK